MNLKFRTNDVELKELADKIGSGVEFDAENADNEPYMILEGDGIKALVDFAKSTKGRMMFALLNR